MGWGTAVKRLSNKLSMRSEIGAPPQKKSKIQRKPMSDRAVAPYGLIEGSEFHDDAKPILEGPAQRFTMPEFLDWHMILDHELNQLSRPETGVIGSLGFVGLGAVVGLIPAVSGVFEKIGSSPPASISGAETATLMVFSGCVVLALGCLLIFGLSIYRNSGLTTVIKARKKNAMINPSARAYEAGNASPSA